MNFFNKKSNNYDENDYEYMDDDMYYENENYNDDYYEDIQRKPQYSHSKHSTKNKENSYINKVRRKSKKKKIIDYSYSTGYKDEEIYYNDDGEAIVDTPKKSYKSIIFLTLGFFYLIFIIIGAFGTTFISGYNAQIVSPTVRSERVIYNKCIKEIENLETTDTFEGVSELQDIYKTNNYQGRIAVLKKTLSKYQQKATDLKSAAYKTKNSDYVNVEMTDMIKDLYNTQITTITQAIKFYESMSGYSSTTDALQKDQDALIEQQQIYKTKLSNYKIRFEEIKKYDLKIED